MYMLLCRAEHGAAVLGVLCSVVILAWRAADATASLRSYGKNQCSGTPYSSWLWRSGRAVQDMNRLR